MGQVAKDELARVEISNGRFRSQSGNGHLWFNDELNTKSHCKLSQSKNQISIKLVSERPVFYLHHFVGDTIF